MAEHQAVMPPDEPLYTVVDRLCGETEVYDENVPRSKREHTKALAYWLKLNSILLEPDGHSTIENVMSSEQYQAFRILREWWTAQYQSPEASLACILAIVDECDELPIEDDTAWLIVNGILASLQLESWPRYTLPVECYDGDRGLSRANSGYNRRLQALFRKEFRILKKRSADEFLRPTRGRLREVTARTAWCQQAAMEVFRSLLETHVEEAPVKGPTDRLMPVRPLSRGPPTKSCPWLVEEIRPETRHLPYYLWDRQKHQTILTERLDTFVDFTAVSHTWGRWQKRSRWTGKVRTKKIKGVPWRVPENLRFEISDLGRRLDVLTCDTRYIWIDLLCIPQQGGEIMKQEISRQAEIFRHAKYAVAWLNDVDSFDALSSALRIMALTTLTLPPESLENAQLQKFVDDEWESLTGKSTGLLQVQEGPFIAALARPNVWFTSLWTLQELCLRPDMWLCAADWEMAKITDSQPATILGFVALWERFHADVFGGKRPRDYTGDWDSRWEMFADNNNNNNNNNTPDLWQRRGGQAPHVFDEITLWIYFTDLHALLNPNPALVMALGDSRACTSRRAEAIMSALGTRKWYWSIPEHKHETDLVLERYPSNFVKELQAAYPVHFFASMVKFDSAAANHSGLDWSIYRHPDNRPDESLPKEFGNVWSRPRGTMLPFSQRGAKFTAGALATQWAGTDCHDCCRDWLVRHDGSVEIRAACIIASSDMPPTTYTPPSEAIFLGFQTDDVPGPVGRVQEYGDDEIHHGHRGVMHDLEAWIHSRCFEVNAVSVGYNHWRNDKRGTSFTLHHGVIIAKVPGTPYVRIGTCFVIERNRPLPGITAVDWLVA